MNRQHEIPIETMTAEQRAFLWQQQQALEFSVPEEKYSKRVQDDFDERLLNAKKRYSCSDSEAVVKLTMDIN